MGAIGSILDGLSRFISATQGMLGNSASESRSLREKIAKEQQRSADEAPASDERT